MNSIMLVLYISTFLIHGSNGIFHKKNKGIFDYASLFIPKVTDYFTKSSVGHHHHKKEHKEQQHHHHPDHDHYEAPHHHHHHHKHPHHHHEPHHHHDHHHPPPYHYPYSHDAYNSLYDYGHFGQHYNYPIYGSGFGDYHFGGIALHHGAHFNSVYDGFDLHHF